jgi:hypothetical protein
MALTTIATTSAQNVIKHHKGRKKKCKAMGLASSFKGK